MAHRGAGVVWVFCYGARFFCCPCCGSKGAISKNFWRFDFSIALSVKKSPIPCDFEGLLFPNDLTLVEG